MLELFPGSIARPTPTRYLQSIDSRHSGSALNSALMEAYVRLNNYANTFDGGHCFRLRLEAVWTAANNGNGEVFQPAIQDIFKTLDGKLLNVLHARLNVADLLLAS